MGPLDIQLLRNVTHCLRMILKRQIRAPGLKLTDWRANEGGAARRELAHKIRYLPDVPNKRYSLLGLRQARVLLQSSLQ